MNMIALAFIKLFDILSYAVFARVLLSWFIRDYANPLMRIAVMLTEPIMGPIRALLDKTKLNGSMFDFSAMFAIVLLQVLSVLVASFLR